MTYIDNRRKDDDDTDDGYDAYKDERCEDGRWQARQYDDRYGRRYGR